MRENKIAARPDKWHGGKLAIAHAQWHVFRILKNHTLGICLLVAATLMYGCRLSSGQPQENASQTVADSNKFLQVLGAKYTAGTQELVALVKEWRRLNIATLSDVSQDSMIVHNVHGQGRLTAFEDSVRSCMVRLIYSQERSLTDYLDVVRGLHDVEMDSLSRELAVSVRHFYHEAGNAPIYRGDAKEAVSKYKQLLETTLSDGIRTKQDAIVFLRQEDVAFRSFLNHLPVLSQGWMPLGGITQDTEQVIRRIIGLAETEPPVLSKSETVILLTMRNNRRLLQNAEACLDDLQRGLVKGGGQAAAYQWMLLRPWLSLDGFAYALMDERQILALESLATKTSGALAGLNTGGCLLETDRLPTFLIQAYLLGLE